MPLAPGLFSTMKFCPSFCCSLSAISRAMVSGVAPAPNGTMMRTVLVGQSCANAGVAAKRSRNANAMRLNSDTPGVSLFASLAAYVRRALPRSREVWSQRVAGGTGMGLAIMIFGLAVFTGAHAFVTRRDQRAALIARFGEGSYKGLFSLISIVGVLLIAWGFARYRATGWIDVWYPPLWTRHIVVALMWIASVCIVAAYSPGKIKATLKHPMLVGVKIWAAAHLIANGDLASIILFGSILAWAVFDRISLKHRTDPGGPPIPAGGARQDIIAVVGGTILYLLLGFLFHPWVVGVPAFGR